MTLAELAVLLAHPVEVGLLVGDVEIAGAGRRTVDLCADAVEAEFGPATTDWQVTGVAIHAPSGRIVRPLAERVVVRAGQVFVLVLQPIVEVAR